MLITSTIIAGGLYYWGLKRLEKREKKTKRLSEYLAKDQDNTKEDIDPIKDYISIVRSEARKQQLKVFDLSEKSEEEKKADQRLQLSLLMLGTSVLGFAAPVFNLVSLPLGVWLSIPYFQRATAALRQERKIVLETVAAGTIAFLLFEGYYLLVALDDILYYANRRLLLKTEDTSTQKALQIVEDIPNMVWLLKDDELELEVPLEELKIDDVISIRSGSRIPVDGIVVGGHGLVDEKLLHGENAIVTKNKGETCFASTMLVDGHLYIQVKQPLEQTIAYQVTSALENSLDYRNEVTAKGQQLADNTALPLLVGGILSYPFVGASGSVAIGMSSYGNNIRAISPLIVLNYLAVSSQEGILIKDGRLLDLMNEIDTVVFDEIGTRTLTQLRFETVHNFGVHSDDYLLQLAAIGAEHDHKIAEVVFNEVQRRNLHRLSILDIDAEEQQGTIFKTSNETLVHVGNARFMEINQIEALTQSSYNNSTNDKILYIAINRKIQGGIQLSVKIHGEIKNVIKQLKEYGIQSYILDDGYEGSPSLDTSKSSEDETVTISRKKNIVESLQAQGKKVAYVGDGLNNAIALQQADIAISLSGATNIATDTAQVIIVSGSLQKVPLLFELGRQFEDTLRSNFNSALTITGLTIAGVLFLNFGVVTAFWARTLSLWGGMASSYEPLIIYNDAKIK